MEAIKTYLDNVFAAFPQTGEVERLKRDMLTNMEEKYLMLRQSGKSEHEAAYSVIANFGSIEEIAAEFGIEHMKKKAEEKKLENNRKGYPADDEKKETDVDIFVSENEAFECLRKIKNGGVMIGLGVWLIIAGVSAILVIDNVFILFLAITAAVPIFIINGTKLSAYKAFEKTNIRFDSQTRETLEYEYERSTVRRTAVVAVGIALIILAAGSFTVIGFPIPLFLNIVGFSVFLFISIGVHSYAYDILLGKGDYANKAAYRQAGRIISTAAAIYWPAATAIFLLWSFLGNAWAISWLVWPVAGILFGAFSAGVSVWFATKENCKG